MYKVGDAVVFNANNSNKHIVGTITRIEFDPIIASDKCIIETARGEKYGVKCYDILGLSKDILMEKSTNISSLLVADSNTIDVSKATTWHIQIPSDIKEVIIDLSDEHYVLPIDTIMGIIKKYAKEVKK